MNVDEEDKERVASPIRFSDFHTENSFGRDEMNLCELPFATLSERNQGRTVLRYETTTKDNLGNPLPASLTVMGCPEFGLPTCTDEQIYLALLKYTYDSNRFSNPQVIVSRPQLFKLLDWPKTKWAYERLHLAMIRLQGVRLIYENLWRDNGKKAYRSEGAFTILDSFIFYDERLSDTDYKSWFRWGNVLFESFQSGYLKKIDYRLTLGLSPIARRLYRYLDKHFYPPHHSTIQMPLDQLTYLHLGVHTTTKLSKARKRYVEPAANELVKADFLKPPTDELFKRINGTWYVTFEIAERKNTLANHCPKKQKIISKLRDFGVSDQKATQLARDYSFVIARNALNAAIEQRKLGKRIEYPDRWFDSAFQNGYKPAKKVVRNDLKPFKSQIRH